MCPDLAPGFSGVIFFLSNFCAKHFYSLLIPKVLGFFSVFIDLLFYLHCCFFYFFSILFSFFLSYLLSTFILFPNNFVNKENNNYSLTRKSNQKKKRKTFNINSPILSFFFDINITFIPWVPVGN